MHVAAFCISMLDLKELRKQKKGNFIRVFDTWVTFLLLLSSDECMLFLHSGHERDSKEGESAGAACMLREPDLSLVQVYRCAAPRLLQELNLQLCLHRSKVRSCVPPGIVNILDISCQDLSAGALHSSDSEVFLEEDGARPLQEAGQRKDSSEEVKVDPSLKKPQISANPRVKKRKPTSDNKGRLINPWIAYFVGANC